MTADPESLFAFIAHGDEQHRDWLRRALQAYFAGEPKPPAYVATDKDAKIAELEDEIFWLKAKYVWRKL